MEPSPALLVLRHHRNQLLECREVRPRVSDVARRQSALETFNGLLFDPATRLALSDPAGRVAGYCLRLRKTLTNYFDAFT